MRVYWEKQKTKDQLEDLEYLQRTYDHKVARTVARRLIEISEAEDYTKIPAAAHPHPIKNGKKTEFYAVDLPGVNAKRGKLRLAFYPKGNYDLAHPVTIKAVSIIGIIDYH